MARRELVFPPISRKPNISALHGYDQLDPLWERAFITFSDLIIDPLKSSEVIDKLTKSTHLPAKDKQVLSDSEWSTLKGQLGSALESQGMNYYSTPHGYHSFIHEKKLVTPPKYERRITITGVTNITRVINDLPRVYNPDFKPVRFDLTRNYLGYDYALIIAYPTDTGIFVRHVMQSIKSIVNDTSNVMARGDFVLEPFYHPTNALADQTPRAFFEFLVKIRNQQAADEHFWLNYLGACIEYSRSPMDPKWMLVSPTELEA